MKKLLSIIMITVILCLCSCGKENVQSDSEKASYTVSVIHGEKSDTGEINIIYPVISGLANEDIQKKLNDRFMSDAIVKESDEGGGLDSYQSYHISPTVMTENNDYLSILVEGDCFYKGAAHPYGFAYTYNIDMKTGENISLTDEEIKDAVSALLNGNYKVVSNVKEITLNDVFWTENGENPSEKEITDNLKSNSNYYREKGKLNLIFSVNHAMGNYVIFEI